MTIKILTSAKIQNFHLHTQSLQRVFKVEIWHKSLCSRGRWFSQKQLCIVQAVITRERGGGVLEAGAPNCWIGYNIFEAIRYAMFISHSCTELVDMIGPHTVVRYILTCLVTNESTVTPVRHSTFVSLLIS